MVRETIRYINNLGYYKTLDIIPQKNGLYFIAISYRGEVISFERNCTEKRVKDFKEKILKTYQIVAADGISNFPDGTYETLLDKTLKSMI